MHIFAILRHLRSQGCTKERRCESLLRPRHWVCLLHRSQYLIGELPSPERDTKWIKVNSSKLSKGHFLLGKHWETQLQDTKIWTSRNSVFLLGLQSSSTASLVNAGLSRLDLGVNLLGLWVKRKALMILMQRVQRVQVKVVVTATAATYQVIFHGNDMWLMTLSLKVWQKCWNCRAWAAWHWKSHHFRYCWHARTS